MYQMFRSQFLAFSIYQSKRYAYLPCLFHYQMHHEQLGISRFASGRSRLRCNPSFWLQASSSSSSITTRAAACTGSGPWERGISWTSQWVSAPRRLLEFSMNVWRRLRRSGSLRITGALFCLCRGISVLDVERFNFPFAISLFWSREYRFFV